MAEWEIPLSGINGIAEGLLLGYDLLLMGCGIEVESTVKPCALALCRT